MLAHPTGALWLWYSGHDGSTERIVTAIQAPGQPWRRAGVAIEAGAAGDTDAFGVGEPCVVRTPAGFLMAYAGSDGATTRIHAAASRDGVRWQPLGPLLQRGDDDGTGATDPCLVVTAGRWMLYFAGFDGSPRSDHSSILGAVSPNGASWDRFGVALRCEAGETGVREPCVIAVHRHFEMLYASRSPGGTEIALATSVDGIEWQRRGSVLRSTTPAGVVRSPWALRARTAHVRL